MSSDSILKIPHHGIWGVPIAYVVYVAFVVALWKGYKRALSATEDEILSENYKLARALWFGRIGVVILALLLSVLAIGFTINGAGSSSGSITVTINL
jgi:hypothetical protein